MQKVLITAKELADIDGISCGIAYAELLNKINGKNFKYDAAFSKGGLFEAEYTCKKLGLTIEQIDTNTHYDKFILVDFGERIGIPSIVRLEDVIEVIDHREFFDAEAFPNAKYQIELVGAAATLIVEKFIKNNAKIKSELSALLAAAIASNTFYFTLSSVTDRDRKAYDFLKRTNEAGYVEKFVDDVLKVKSQFTIDNIERALIEDKKSGYNNIEIIKSPTLYQLELKDAEPILKMNVVELFNQIAPEIENQILILHGLKQKATFLVCINDSLAKKLAEVMGGWVENVKDNIVTLNGVYFRKHIIKKLLDA